MKKVKNIFLIIISLIVFQSCNTVESEIPSHTFIEINFKIYESYVLYGVVEKPKIFISLFTEKIYGCSNYRLDTEISIINKNIVVKIIDLIIPNVCLTSLGPATSRNLLDISDGDYNLNIHSGSYQNIYQCKKTFKRCVFLQNICQRQSRELFCC